MISKTLLTVFSLLGLSVRGQTEGLRASLDIAVIEQAKDTYFASLIDLINGFHFSEVARNAAKSDF